MYYRIRNNIGYSEIVNSAQKLEGSFRGPVVSRIHELRDSYCEFEHQHVVQNIERKLTLVGNDSTFWVRVLGDAFSELYSYYASKVTIQKLNYSTTLKMVGATLYYFIDPIGVIPDYDPDNGYVDDAFAFYFCVRQLPKNWSNYYPD